ncbi:lipoprotein 17-related variable surface protein [Mycoplasmopsis lipofaciens]|uniref:lipoprotein 17-related variable surface protein n=1 Tax=Mycoplasmopsis lipofaciens TaxID=114884 RepID=UPI00048257A2|nr:lipoprotein 17-related variable surface protein [Mycoplasmopsis lipofaciens]
MNKKLKFSTMLLSTTLVGTTTIVTSCNKAVTQDIVDKKVQELKYNVNTENKLPSEFTKNDIIFTNLGDYKATIILENINDDLGTLTVKVTLTKDNITSKERSINLSDLETTESRNAKELKKAKEAYNSALAEIQGQKDNLTDYPETLNTYTIETDVAKALVEQEADQTIANYKKATTDIENANNNLEENKENELNNSKANYETVLNEARQLRDDLYGYGANEHKWRATQKWLSVSLSKITIDFETPKVYNDATTNINNLMSKVPSEQKKELTEFANAFSIKSNTYRIKASEFNRTNLSYHFQVKGIVILFEGEFVADDAEGTVKVSFTMHYDNIATDLITRTIKGFNKTSS